MSTGRAQARPFTFRSRLIEEMEADAKIRNII